VPLFEKMLCINWLGDILAVESGYEEGCKWGARQKPTDFSINIPPCLTARLQAGIHPTCLRRVLCPSRKARKKNSAAGVSNSLVGGLYHQCGGCPSNAKSGLLPRLPLFRLKEVGNILGGLCRATPLWEANK